MKAVIVEIYKLEKFLLPSIHDTSWGNQVPSTQGCIVACRVEEKMKSLVQRLGLKAKLDTSDKCV